MRYRRQDSLERAAGGRLELGEGRGRRRRKAVAVLPTLFTLGNCICGFASMHYAARGTEGASDLVSNYAVAGYLIFASMIFDMFDGRMARLAKVTSEFGKELDSLADMVSFGVAPAFLTLQLVGDLMAASATGGAGGLYREALGPNADDVMGKLFWIIGAVYVACTALRLARYNITPPTDGFKGLPSPGGAAVVASTIIFYEMLSAQKHLFWWVALAPGAKEWLKTLFPYVMPAVLLASGLLMVSRFKYTHVANRYLRGRRSFDYVVRLMVVLMLLAWQPQITALAVIYLYALSAPTTWVWRRLTGREEPKLVEEAEERAGEGAGTDE